MSESNLEVVRAVHSAFLDRDEEAFLSRLDEGVVWNIGGFLTGTATYRGTEGVRRWWRDLEGLSGEGEELESRFEDERELADGRVLALGRGVIRRRHGDLPTEFAVVYTLEGGKITVLQSFPDHETALRELGLEGV